MTIEVIVRKQKLQITNGRQITATIPKLDGKYDIKKLSADLQTLKREYGDKDDATLLVEPEVEYEDVIHVMDAMKVAVVKNKDDGEPVRMDLFPQLSLGDAP